MKKTIYLFAASILLLIMGLCPASSFMDYHYRTVKYFVPRDLNGDGNDDLLIFYRGFEKSENYFIEGTDLKNQRILWRSQVKDSGINAIELHPSHDNERFYFTRKKYYEKHLGSDLTILAFRLRDGKPVWV